MLSEGTQSEKRDRVSPAFVGRGEQLALAERRWEAAVAGSGHLLLIAGEAGIGKTRLLREITDALPDARVLTASVFPRDFEAVGGLLLDLADELERAGDSDSAATQRDRLMQDAVDPRDSARSRRILVGDLAGAVLRLLAERPTLLRLEDLHWADELSLDVLERVAATLRTTPSMIVATYRSDELYPRTPLRRVRTRLLEQRLAEEVRLPRLTPAETSEMVESIIGDTPARVDVESLVSRSDGIPLFIEELLADVTNDSVPETIADAITMRLATLPAPTVSIVEAASVIGRSFDVDLLEGVSAVTPDEVDHALRELTDHSLVVAGNDGTTFDFRHALIRDAVYEQVSPLRKRSLHASVAAAAVADGFGDSFVSDQFERARRPREAFEHSMTAAREAVRVSAHREAAQLLRRAQRTMSADADPLERAELLAALGAELSAADDNEGAAAEFAAAIGLYRDLGDEIAAAQLVPKFASARHQLGDDYDARATLIIDALARVDAVGADVPIRVRAGLLAALSAAYMLDRCLDDALQTGIEAAALADADGALDERIDIDLTVGAVQVFAGRPDLGWPLLESAIPRAKDAGFETETARGYRMIGSSASVLVEYPRAFKWIAEGLDYTASAERWNDHHYLAAHHAHVLWATGHWPEAEFLARRALADGRGGITTRNAALIVLGYLAMGRGDFATARTLLDEARAIGTEMRELQRLVPPLWGLAEVELRDGHPELAIELSEFAYSKSQPIGDAAYIFPFLITGVRAHLALRHAAGARDWFERCAYLVHYREIPGIQTSAVHAEGLLLLAEGQTGAARELLERASAEWDANDRMWEGTQALIDLAHCANRSRRQADAARLVTLARSRADAAGASVLDVAADAIFADPASETNTGPLSLRELEVARLIAAGAT
ncbi:MAG TPA: AAA family ATPase, partial [Galbitalea sp.]